MAKHEDWLLDTGVTALGFEDENAKKRYKHFMRPEPYQDMGPIEEEYDIITDSVMKFRMMSVGMTRNAAEEDRQDRKVYLNPLPHIRIPKAKLLQGWYKGRGDELDGKRPRPCFTDALLTEPLGGFCTVGCAFCYLNSGTRGYRGSGLITVPLGYGAQVAAMLREMKTSAAGYFSSFTDPFLPLEDLYHNTEQGARAFVREGLPVFFLSRLAYPGWAFDLLTQNKYSYAQKSLNTGVDADFKRFSPGALSLPDHLEQLRELRKRGVYTSIQVNPVVAGVTTHDHIRTLFERLAEVGNNHVIVKFVEAGFSWAPAMVERIEKRFGAERGAKFRDLFTQNIGGQRTIAEEYRLDAHAKYQKWATELKMTFSTCYEYKYERDADGEPLSKLGQSVGRDFITSEQCHGHRVPMFTRAALDAPFTEVAECPPTGCMYCAEDHGKAKCGNDTLGAAKALRFADYKEPVYGGRKTFTLKEVK